MASATARIGAALGRPVGAEPSLGRLPVLVDSKGGDPNATLRALAFALHASVVTDGKALRIERTSPDRKAVEGAHRAAIRAQIVSTMAGWDDTLKRADALGDIATQVERARADWERVLRNLKAAREAGQSYVEPPGLFTVGRVNPVGRLTRTLMTLLGPDRLADLAPGEIRCYSDHPNGAESGLPNCAEALATYVRTQREFAKRLGLPEPGGPPAKVVLKVTESGIGLDLYDAQGMRRDHDDVGYGIGSVVVFTPPPSPGVAPAWVDLDRPTQGLRSFLAVPNGTVDRQRYAALPDAVLHPERTDPLDFEVRTALLATASPGGKGLVVALTDGLLSLAEPCVKDDRLDTAAFAWRLEHEGGYERAMCDGTAVMRPKDAWPAEAWTVDRTVLGQSIRRIKADGEITLANWSALCWALYPRQSGAVADRYLRPVNLGFSRGFWDSLGPGPMALFGAALRANVPVADGAAPPFGRLIRDGIVQGWLVFSGPAGASDLDLAPSSLLSGLDDAQVVMTAPETLVAEPYGGFDDKGAPVRLAYEELDVKQLRSSFAGQRAEELGASESNRAFSSDGGRTSRAEKLATIAYKIRNLHYLLGQRREMGLTVGLRSGSRARLKLQETTVDRQGTTFDNLPEAFQAALLRGAEQGIDHPTDIFGRPIGSR